MDFTELFKALAGKPELALIAIVMIGCGWLVKDFSRRQSSVSTKLIEVVSQRLENIDKNFTSIADDVRILRSKLESHIVITDDRVEQLDKRVEKLEERKEA